jgi:peptidoglycan recognition protein
MTTFLRADWGAPTPPGGAVLTGPLLGIAIHHTAARVPHTEQEALREVLRIYSEHTSLSSSDPSKPWSDIGYSWLVDAWGNIYEGRGWLRVGAHTPGFNSKVHAIAYIGWGIEPIPQPAIAAMARCVVDGQLAGAVSVTPTFMGHRDAVSTACPGDGLYGQLALIEAAVVDLPPATINPPEDDVLTPEQATQLAEVRRDIVDDHLAGRIVSQLDVRLNALAARLDSIDQRLGAIEAGEMPTPDELVVAAARRIALGAP